LLVAMAAGAQLAGDRASFVLRVDVEGSYSLPDVASPLDDASVVTRAAAALNRDADVAIVVEGDAAAPYARVARAAALLQQAGARRIAFRTTNPNQP
jgi:biopolymer transport protein ExbD